MARPTSAARPAAAGDPVLAALAEVVETAEYSRGTLDRLATRAHELRAGRAQGLSYSEIVTATDGPLVIELVTDLIDNFLNTGSKLRRAEARALYAEGLTMEKISLLLRVSRQRVSAIIHGENGVSIEAAQGDLARAKALALTDTEFRMIAESWPQIVWVVGPDGGAEYVNRVGTAYSGLSLDEISGQGWIAILHPDDMIDVTHLWEEAVQTEASFELEYRLRRFDGEFRSHLSRYAPIRNAAGAVTKWLGIVTDVEGEKIMRANLDRALQEAADAQAMLRPMPSGSSVASEAETAL